MHNSSWIELSSSAFAHNIEQFRQSLPTHVSIAVVLKSNAYGHGLSPMGQLSEKNGNIDYLCVFFLHEALQLRDEGVTKPVLVLGFVDGPIEDAIEYDIDLVCFDRAQLKDFNVAAQKLNKSINVHIKVDTGLSRLGFFPGQVLGIVQEICDNYPMINIKGIMTHFSESGSLDVQWTERQERVFTETIELLRRKDKTFEFVHASNTAATMRFPNSRFKMVRIGGGSYGFPQRTVPTFDLKPVLTLKSRIMCIKELPAGSFVSYDRLYQAPVARKIAIIPAGYSDGYGRRKPAGLHVLINGALAPALGSVCMNVFIVDISHIPDVTLSSEVTLIGQHVGIRAVDIASLIGCVNYEVTTALNPTLKRIMVI